MQTNKIKTYNSVVYPKSFYQKLKEEQEQFIIKNRENRTSMNGINNCVIQEVDCERSLLRLKNSDFHYTKKSKKQTTNRNRRRTEKADKGKKVVAFKTAAISSPKEVVRDLDETENEKCVIEELDCRLSLIQIGYHKEKEENKTDLPADLVRQAENTNQEVVEVVLEEEAMETTDGQTSDLTQTIYEESVPVYDINRYASWNIVDTVFWYTEDKEDVEEILEEDMSIDFNSDKPGLEGNNNDLQAEGHKEKVVLWSCLQMKARLLAEGLDKNLLHSEELHTNNQVGYLSLLAVLGLLGIFTDNTFCLGFWGFLYFIKYFYVKPDEVLKNHVILSAAYGYVAGMVISFQFIILGAIFDNNTFFIYGMGVATVISVLVFTLVLYILQLKSTRQEQREVEQKQLEQKHLEPEETQKLSQDTLIAMEHSQLSTPKIPEEE